MDLIHEILQEYDENTALKKKEIVENHTCNKGLLSTIYKEHSNFNIKESKATQRKKYFTKEKQRTASRCTITHRGNVGGTVRPHYINNQNV